MNIIKTILYNISGVFMLTWLVTSCYPEQILPVESNFSIEVVDADWSVPVQVKVINNTTGALWYNWQCEGSSTEFYDRRDLPLIKYETPGVYKIKLKAGNDDAVDSMEVEISIDEKVDVTFEADALVNNYAPAEVLISNKTNGACEFSWEFPGGTPSVSNEQNPGIVTYNNSGEYTISLTASNGREQYSYDTTIVILNTIEVGFDYSVEFIDSDFEAPVIVSFENNSSDALVYEWTFEGGDPTSSTEKNPVVVFPEAGTFSVSLTAGNMKTEKCTAREITIYPDKNLLSFNDVKFGVFGCCDSIGTCFSSYSGKCYREKEIDSDNGKYIDFVFFGMDSDFNLNLFVSPDKATDYAFKSIPGAINTSIVNSQELCRCSYNFTESDFNAIETGDGFAGVETENWGEWADERFSSELLPRIIVIETADGRKGAIMINDYVNNGTYSYIVADIKIQKKGQ